MIKTIRYSISLIVAFELLSACKEVVPSGSSVSNSKTSGADAAVAGSGSSDSGGGGGTGTDPATITKAAVEQAGPIGNRRYIADVLKDIFNSTLYTNNIDALLAGSLDNPGVYGLACDFYSSASWADCNGDVSAGSVAPVMSESNTVRQLSTLKLCEDVLTRANSVKAAAEKIGELTGGLPNDITATNMPKIFGLFFRGRDITNEELNAYLAFNATLKGPPSNLSIQNRWNSILVMLCETPDWQTF